jgi:hypothetical protein
LRTRFACVSSAPFGVVLARLGHLGHRLGGADQLLELAGLHQDALGARLLGAGLRVIGEPLPGKEQLRARVLEVEGHLALSEQHVHRHDDAAGAQDAVVDDREIGDVGQHDPDAVPAGEAVLAQETDEMRAGAVELPVRQLDVVEADRDVVGVVAGGVNQDLGQVHCRPPVREVVAGINGR